LVSTQLKNENTVNPVFQNQSNGKQQSSIAKFDYCLPPDEYTGAETGKQTNAA
jgi:hypothetical protein